MDTQPCLNICRNRTLNTKSRKDGTRMTSFTKLNESGNKQRSQLISYWGQKHLSNRHMMAALEFSGLPKNMEMTGLKLPADVQIQAAESIIKYSRTYLKIVLIKYR